MKKNIIRNAKTSSDAPMFTSLDDKASIQRAGAAFAREGIVHRSKADISVRRGLSREDYNVHRPDEAAPSEVKDVIKTSMWSYKRIGLVHNVIDLMADFACQGIEIVHPNKKIQKFLNVWAKKVKFKERSERFLNLLYRTGNVVLRRIYAQLPQRYLDNLQRVVGEADVEPELLPKVKKGEIPFGYVYHNPLSIEVVGDEETSLFAGKVQYGLRVSLRIAGKVRTPKTLMDRLFVQSLPDSVVNSIRKGDNVVPLDPTKVSLYHYKKDDWECFAEPITGSILDDLTMLNKIKLADMAALDGAVNHIRLWKLGSLEHKIYPTDAAVARLSEMLANAIGTGPIDIIWGPELSLEETNLESYKFLGSEKYKAVLIAIYDGLGIPLALTGYASEGGLSNNFLSLKTLIERLQYGRDMLTSMWQDELAHLQAACQFRQPATLRYSRMTLADESAEKALLLQMADRNIISTQSVVERFGEDPDIELYRQNREAKERAAGRRPRQASQWHAPEYKEKLATIALQTGVVTPGQVGLDLLPAKPGETPAMEMKLKSQEATRKISGRPGQGRPVGKKDSQKRKAKRTSIQRKPSNTIANALMWARAAQGQISEVVNEWYLASAGKKNMRQVPDEQANQLELFKYALLCNTQLYSNISSENIVQMIQGNPMIIPDKVVVLYDSTMKDFTRKFNREPSADEVRQIQAAVYALYISEV